MDTFVDQSTLLGDEAGGRQQPQHPQARARRADAADLRRGHRRCSTSSATLLHGLFSNAKYPLLSGTNGAARLRRVPVAVQRDVGARARGARELSRSTTRPARPMPKALLDKVLAGADLRPGLRDPRVPGGGDARPVVAPDARGRQLPSADDVMAFEARRSTKDRRRLRARSRRAITRRTSSHIFAGGYEAGYYAYIWSEVLARDSGAWFHDARRPHARERRRVPRRRSSRAAAPRSRACSSRTSTADAPDIGPLLEYRGLADTKTVTSAAARRRPPAGALRTSPRTPASARDASP